MSECVGAQANTASLAMPCQVVNQINARKKYEARMEMWELRKFIDARSRYLNAKAAEEEAARPKKDPVLHLMDSPITKMTWSHT